MKIHFSSKKVHNLLLGDNYSTKFGTLLPLYMKKRLVGRKKSKILLLCVMASLIILTICENKKIIRFYGYEKYSGINCIFLTNNRRKMLNKHNITKQFWKICRNNMTYQYSSNMGLSKVGFLF